MKFLPAMLLGIAALSASGAYAQAYPVKPVRVVVPWPPAASNDIVARVLAHRLSENLGQQFVVENRAGAGSVIGTEVVAKSVPDGYTMLITSTTHVGNASLYKKLPYDALRDFTGITALSKQVGILVIHPSVPAKNVKELVALARARPGEVIYGSTGPGSFTHLSMALFNHLTQTKMLHVAYKGGGPAIIALASGEIHAFVSGISAVIPHIKSGRLRALGVGSTERASQFPDVPTLAEAGATGYDFTAWVGSFVPAATPKPIVEKLNLEMKKALEHPDVARNLISQTLDPMYMTLEQFAARLKADSEKYEKLVKLSGAKIE